MPKKEHFLIWTKESGEEEAIQIKNEMIFGRKGECDFSIKDQLVSGKHFQLSPIGQTLYITDLQSFNKTFINDVEISPDKKVGLAENDLIKAGKQQFTYLQDLSKRRPNNSTASKTSSDQTDSLKLQIENLKTDGQHPEKGDLKNDIFLAFQKVQGSMEEFKTLSKNPNFNLSTLNLDKGEKKKELQDLLSRKKSLSDQCVELKQEIDDILVLWRSFF